MQSKDNNDDNANRANMMNLCRVLVGTGPASDDARRQCATQQGRVKLLGSYGIAAEKQGDPGYALAYYEQGNNFNLAIQGMVDLATQILAGQSYQGAAVRDQLDDWEPTSVFELLYSLTQDESLRQQLDELFATGSTTAQQQFLEQHLPEDFYAEREAIRALLSGDQDKELGTSLSKVMTTFEANYQFLC
jgi:hypothetical protein